MVPVAAVTSEPGGVEAQHSANLSGTQPCNQPFEAGPRHHHTGGPAEIVIDDLVVMDAPLPRDINKLVLPPLALEIGLDLRLRRLPNIDHRLPLQLCRSQTLSP